MNTINLFTISSSLTYMHKNMKQALPDEVCCLYNGIVVCK